MCVLFMYFANIHRLFLSSTLLLSFVSMLLFFFPRHHFCVVLFALVLTVHGVPVLPKKKPHDFSCRLGNFWSSSDSIPSISIHSQAIRVFTSSWRVFQQILIGMYIRLWCLSIREIYLIHWCVYSSVFMIFLIGTWIVSLLRRLCTFLNSIRNLERAQTIDVKTKKFVSYKTILMPRNRYSHSFRKPRSSSPTNKPFNLEMCSKIPLLNRGLRIIKVYTTL
jgi:hypothetical protein